MPDFKNKVVVVTGGAQGIGLGCCRAFALAGASVYSIDADEEALRELASEFHPCAISLTRRRSNVLAGSFPIGLTH